MKYLSFTYLYSQFLYHFTNDPDEPKKHIDDFLSQLHEKSHDYDRLLYKKGLKQLEAILRVEKESKTTNLLNGLKQYNQTAFHPEKELQGQHYVIQFVNADLPFDQIQMMDIAIRQKENLSRLRCKFIFIAKDYPKDMLCTKWIHEAKDIVYFLVDPSLSVARECGVVFSCPPELEEYFSLHLGKSPSQNRELVVPATFLIDVKDHMRRLIFMHVEMCKRINVEYLFNQINKRNDFYAKYQN